MGVVSSTLIKENKQGSFSMPRNFTYVTSYRVETDDPTDGELTVFQDARRGHVPEAAPHPIPAPYDTYNYEGEQDINAFAMDYSIVRLGGGEDKKKWVCTVTHRQMRPGEDPSQDVGDPLARPPIWWNEFETTTEEAYEAILQTDLTGPLGAGFGAGTNQSFINAVGDPIADSIQLPRQYTIWAVQQNYATTEEIAQLGAKYSNKRNDALWRGFAAGTVLFRSISSGMPLTENGAQYWQAVIRFKIDTQDSHAVKLPNKGLRYAALGNDPTADLRDFDNWSKQKLTQPVWLALNGTQAGRGLYTTIDYNEDNLITFGTDLP